MKNSYKYVLYLVNIILIGMICFNVATYDFEPQTIEISSKNIEKSIGSEYISSNLANNIGEETDSKEENIERTEKEKPTVTEQKVVEEIKTEIIETKIEETKPKEETKQEQIAVIEELVGKLAGYGPDCYGCTSFRTASGRYIGEGNIYFDDYTYGKIRIIAGDYSYPFGTIVKISNVNFYNNEPFYAVVLDRGGSVGKGKTFLFDLLFESESKALQMGSEYNIKFEIVRLGY